MTALAQNTTYYTHPTGNPTRRGGSLILRNVHIFVGALCFFHDDGVAASSRLMPARSLSNTNTPGQGGPLLLNIDSSQWVGVIAKAPNIRLAMTVSGAGTVTALTVTYGSTIDISFNIGSTATSTLVVSTLRANADVMRLIDIGIVSKAGGAATAQTVTPVPYVRIAGYAKKEFDNTGAATDLAISEIIELDTGKGFMANDTTDPASASDVGGMIAILDDQTIARTPAPLMLPAFLFDWQPVHAGATGPCIHIP